MADCDATPVPAEPSLPEYLGEFLGQFVADPGRINEQMACEFLRDFYLWTAQAFPAAREYATSQLRQIDLWRAALQQREQGWIGN